MGVGAKRRAGFVIISEPIPPHLAVPRLVLGHGRKRCLNWFCSRLDSPRLVGRHRGFSSPSAVAAAEILVVSGKEAMKRERTPGSVWVLLGESRFVVLWVAAPLGVFLCSLGAAWSCQAEVSPPRQGSPHGWWETICSPPPICSGLCRQARLYGADSSELPGLCFLWQNATSCAFPVTCLAALLVVQTCSAEEGEEWVLPTRRMSCWLGRGGDPLCQTTYRGKKKINPTAFVSHFFVFQLKEEPR